jgi:taurine dioxygenase
LSSRRPCSGSIAERFGALTLGHPTIASPDGQPFLEEIDSHKGGTANQWHTDVALVDRPPAFTFLYGVVIPELGGDTIRANTVAAYESLPVELRGRVTEDGRRPPFDRGSVWPDSTKP